MRSELGRWTDMVLAAMPSLRFAKESVESEILAMSTLVALHGHSMLPPRATFVGGTALRLCYGSPRMSVDLDFHLPPDEPRWQLDRPVLAAGIEDVIAAPVDVSRPSEQGSRMARISAILPERTRDVKRPRTMLDVGRAESLDASASNVFLRFAGSPPGVGDLHTPFAIMTASIEEILVNKHLALVGRARRVKQRDVFDILWLRQRGVRFDADMLAAKLRARADADQFPRMMKARAEVAAADMESGAYRDEVAKFLPSDSTWLFQDRDMGMAFARLIGEHADAAARAIGRSSRSGSRSRAARLDR